MHSLHLSAIMFPGPRLKKHFKHNVRQNEKYTVNLARKNVSLEQIACENPSVGSKFAANYPGRHLHISTRISHILLSVGIFGHQLRELTPVWSQSPPDSSEYSNILKWVGSIIVKYLIDWIISMCFYWMLSISSISFKAIIKSASNHRALHLSLMESLRLPGRREDILLMP